jgi:hypothetical protein
MATSDEFSTDNVGAMVDAAVVRIHPLGWIHVYSLRTR